MVARWLASLAIGLAGAVLVSPSTPMFIEQGFSFDYTPSGKPVPIPTTAQCDTIPLTWGRASFTTGPNPQAPYYIQVYTSTFLFLSVINVGSSLQFDWPVPYIPGTQYQICMFDSNGVSGGCQRMTTVVLAENTTLENPPICTNLTYPAGILDVEANDHTGTLSQFGWVDQCTDISIRPKNGTPPFILTVAPTLHPPWNITSNDMSSINWTVQLSWGSSFFVSLVDANGQTWAHGPLHSGGQGPTDCLSLSAGMSGNDVSESVAIGSGVGGLFAGLVVGGVAAWFFLRRRPGPYYEPYVHRIHSGSGKDDDRLMDDALSSPFPTTTHTHTAIPTNSSDGLRTATTSFSRNRQALAPGSAYEIEPFTLPDSSSEGLLPRSSTAEATSPLRQPTSPVSNGSHRNADALRGDLLETPSTLRQASTAGGGQVYVVHHDGGRAPVTVYTSDGTEIIELPPRYNTDDPPHEEHRRVGSSSRKDPRPPDSMAIV